MIRRALLASSAALIFCLLILPALLVRGCTRAPGGSGLSIALYQARSKRVVRMDIEDYLVGVVAAEMPAYFSLEALKAQAIAARTLAVRRLPRNGGRGSKYSTRADVSDQPGDGQAWLADTDLRKNWGRDYRRFLSRVTRAVQETRGLVLLYDHRLIDAVYHSTCGGRTEDASLVWGHRIPYLASVKCDFDRISPRYRTRVRISRTEMARRLGFPKAPADAAALVPQIRGRTASGRVTGLTVAGRSFTGAAFRDALGLRSTIFTCRAEGSHLVFDVRGYGHGVGLCQYGAEGMARKGADCLQILRHYYQGVNLGRLGAAGSK